MFGVARAGGSPCVAQAPRAAHERFLVPRRGPLMARGGGPLTVRSPICDFFFFSVSSNKTFFYFFFQRNICSSGTFFVFKRKIRFNRKNFIFVLIELLFSSNETFCSGRTMLEFFFLVEQFILVMEGATAQEVSAQLPLAA